MISGSGTTAAGRISCSNCRTWEYSLSWDSAHRLLSTQAPGHSESYRYDAHGHRVRTQRSGETVWSVYSRAGTLLFEQTSLGQNRRHIHLGARQVAETRNGQRRYLHTDHLGTPRVQTDAFGTVVQRDVRAPYGSVLAGFDYRQGAGFTGHMEDGATALTYMKARYYDPVAMRFLSPDPVYVDLGTGGNFNRYWYANNNPYKFVDPDGRQASCANAKNAAACAAAGMGGRQAAVDAAAKTVARDAAKIGLRGALANEVAQSDSVDPSSSTSKPNSQSGEQASATGGRTRGLPPEGVVPPVAKPERLREGAPSRPSEERAGGRSLWDEDGGEWRYHPGDKHHNPHWDYNPHTEKFGPWQNVPIGDLPVYKPLF